MGLRISAAILSLSLAGCLLAQDAMRASREANAAVKKGEVLRQPDGLFLATVPDEPMYALWNPLPYPSLGLYYRDFWSMTLGPFYVAEIQGGGDDPEAVVRTAVLDRFHDLHLFVGRERKWSGRPGYYVEFFTPDKNRRRWLGETRELLAMQHVALLVRTDAAYLFVYHADPVWESEPPPSQVDPKTLAAFEQFLQGVSID